MKVQYDLNYEQKRKAVQTLERAYLYTIAFFKENDYEAKIDASKILVGAMFAVLNKPPVLGNLEEIIII